MPISTAVGIELSEDELASVGVVEVSVALVGMAVLANLAIRLPPLAVARTKRPLGLPWQRIHELDAPRNKALI